MRLREAKALFKAGEYSGAYYLAGYAIECGLKACIARGTQRYDFPDKEHAIKSFVHNPTELIKAAGLFGPLQLAMRTNPRPGGELGNYYRLVGEEPVSGLVPNGCRSYD